MTLVSFEGLEPFADLIKEIYGDLAKPGVQNVGIALSAVLGFGITLMWPIMWANERAKIALENNLEQYRERLKDVSPEQIIPVAPEVAMPILEKLGYVTNEELRNLYIELLAKASIKDLNSKAHPSFVNIINNLSPDEAKLIQSLSHSGSIPFVHIIYNLKDGNGYNFLEELLVIIPSLSIDFPDNLSAYFSNLSGAGIVEIAENLQLAGETYYQPYEEYLNTRKGVYDLVTQDIAKTDYPYELKKGTIKITKFGKLFFHAVLKSS